MSSQRDDIVVTNGLSGAMKMLGPRWRMLLLAVLSICVFTGASLAKPLVIQYALDHGVADKSTDNLVRAAVLFFVLILVVYLFQAVATYTVNILGQDLLYALRVRLFTHYQRMSLSFFGRQSAGRLVSRMTADIATLTDVLNNGFLMLVQSTLTLLGATIILFGLSWRLSLATAVIIPPLIIATAVFRVASQRAYGSVRERIADVLVHMQESFSGLRVVQAFAREQHNMERFGAINERNYEANVRSVRISALYFPVVEFLGVLGISIILWYGGRQVAGDRLTVGTVAAFVFYLDFIFQPIQNLSQVFDMAQSAGAALNKIFGLLAVESDLAEPENPESLPANGAGRIALEGVTFGYDPLVPVLRDIDVVIEPGQHVVLVGPTGAGKSTLAKLMTRFYDPVEGRVTVDGHDLRNVRSSDLRQHITMVPQEGFLFTGTIRENILFGKPNAMDEEVVQAAKTLGIHSFIESLQQGYETLVSYRGSRLSAGEKQLISIARAFVANPPVLILDEATSSLDPSTEEMVEVALRGLLKGRTSVVIAHRLSTAEHADRVLVVDHGHIVEDGSHAELVRRNGYYSALYRQWTSGREPGREEIVA
ncbi:MAG: ABC transporter ATP-binding protein [Anaerolineaceae bacterium]